MYQRCNSTWSVVKQGTERSEEDTRHAISNSCSVIALITRQWAQLPVPFSSQAVSGTCRTLIFFIRPSEIISGIYLPRTRGRMPPFPCPPNPPLDAALFGPDLPGEFLENKYLQRGIARFHWIRGPSSNYSRALLLHRVSGNKAGDLTL